MTDPVNNQNNCDLEGNLKRLQAGSILISRSDLHDSNFKATAVLLCVHGQDGVYGLVLNRLVHMPVSEIFDGFSGINVMKEIHIGGPVHQDELQIIQITEHPMEGAYQIVPNVYVGGKWGSIDQIMNADKTTTWLFLGYSGWSIVQLEAEVRASLWDVYKVDVNRLLMDPLQCSVKSIKEIVNYLESIRLD